MSDSTSGGPGAPPPPWSTPPGGPGYGAPPPPPPPPFGAPPPPPYGAPPPPPPYGGGYPPAPPGYGVGPPQTEPLAVTSLVLGIASFVTFWFCPFVAAIVGLVLSFSARRSIRESAGTKTGEGLANAGMILSIINIALTAIGAVILILVAVSGGFSSSSGS